MRTHRSQILFLAFLIGSLILGAITGCATSPEEAPRQDGIKYAEITFTVQLPDTSQAEADYFIEIVDEIAGLAINPLRYTLSPLNKTDYQITLPFQVGSVVKYRYLKKSDIFQIENSTDNKPIRFRVLIVDGVSTIEDSVSCWPDQTYSGTTGQIEGQLLNATGSPIPGVLITVGGLQTISTTDGAFFFDQMAPGTHLLSAISINGDYQPYQQGVTVADKSATPVLINLNPSSYVDITFKVTPPPNTAGLPIRLVGNLSNLGNTFTDLYAGSSVLPSRAPLLLYNANGYYSITLKLPVGLDLRYRYSLGDGFWNGEINDSGIEVRQLIVSEKNSIRDDTIESWALAGSQPITFTLAAPPNTPSTDMISIQFNAFGWSTPIPMWPLGNNQWYYILYSPFDNLAYRYCRNDQCGIADDALTTGASTAGRIISAGVTAVVDVIEAWQWLPTESETSINADVINPRGPNFIAAVEIQSNYHPSWLAYYPRALQNIKDIGANWIIIPASWSYSSFESPKVDCPAGSCISHTDLQSIAQYASTFNLKTIIFPQSGVVSTDEFWGKSDLSNRWWGNWFDQYQHLLLSNAKFAAQNNIQAMIIGEPYLAPAITGILPDGSLSNLPSDSNYRWEKMIADIRDIYKGQIFWAVDYSGQVAPLPDWVDKFDGVYVLWHASIADNFEYDITEVTDQTGDLMDTDIYPIYEQYKKPIIIATNYAAVEGALQGCFEYENSCIAFANLDQPQADKYHPLEINNQVQVDAYTALLSVINQRDWISGFASQGYYPPAALRDNSSSIHGKPGADVLWYWYPRILSETIQ